MRVDESHRSRNMEGAVTPYFLKTRKCAFFSLWVRAFWIYLNLGKAQGEKHTYTAPCVSRHIRAFFSGAHSLSSRGRGRSLSGGANIHIFVFTDLENNGFQKTLIRQNMNIWILASPPLFDLPRPLLSRCFRGLWWEFTKIILGFH